MSEFSHTDEKGKAKMVNVGHKPDQNRIAIASGEILLQNKTISLIRSNELKKGDVLAVARIAGITGAKRTGELIPLCHPLQIHGIDVEFTIDRDRIGVEARVETTGKTGVEMEALTAVNISLLTIYDMCKAVDKEMIIQNIRLKEKTKK